MIHPYNPATSNAFYGDYYKRQVGDGLAVFRGATVQRGHGIGGFFSGLLKGTLPAIKSGAKVLGKQLLKTGMDITGDLLSGKNIKDSAKDRFSESGQQMIKQLSTMIEGNGLKRKVPGQSRRNKKQKTNNKNDIFNKPFK